jgi:hypothetical protein
MLHTLAVCSWPKPEHRPICWSGRPSKSSRVLKFGVWQFVINFCGAIAAWGKVGKISNFPFLVRLRKLWRVRRTLKSWDFSPRTGILKADTSEFPMENGSRGGIDGQRAKSLHRWSGRRVFDEVSGRDRSNHFLRRDFDLFQILRIDFCGDNSSLIWLADFVQPLVSSLDPCTQRRSFKNSIIAYLAF